MLEDFGNWLAAFEAHRLMNANDWLWPLCEMIHFIGMALLIGSVGLLDFRILGIGKGLPISRLETLVPIGVAGFIANTVTGSLFIIANPTGGPNGYLLNLAFQIKMILILVAGINAIAFYFTGISEKMTTLGPLDEASSNAKVVAAVSLAAWIGVIIFGRLIMYNDTLLWFLGM